MKITYVDKLSLELSRVCTRSKHVQPVEAKLKIENLESLILELDEN